MYVQLPVIVPDAPETTAPPGRASWIVAIDTDYALFGLIQEWLAAEDCGVTLKHIAKRSASERIDLLIVDIPFPRQGGLDLLRRVAHEHPGVPIIALSSTFFAGIESNGAIARSLGVACALPKPVKRDALIGAVMALLPASRRAAAL